MAEKDIPRGVDAGRQSFTDRRLPTRAAVKGSRLANGRKLHAVRGDHAASSTLLAASTDDPGGDAG